MRPVKLTRQNQEGLRPALNVPLIPLCLFLPAPALVAGYHWGQCGQHTQPANEWRRPSSAPALTMPGRQAKAISLHYEDSIFLPYYPVCHVLLDSKDIAVSYIIIIFFPQRWRAPGKGPFGPSSCPGWPRAFPWWQKQCSATTGDICIPIRLQALKSVGGGHWQPVCKSEV